MSAEYIKKKRNATKAVGYGTISLVCVSSRHWTAGPQRAVFHQRRDHRRLEAWPCLPQKAHSHTTKCSLYNQAAQPLWFPLLLRETHTHTHTRKHTHLYANTVIDTGEMRRVYPRTQISLLCKAVQRERGGGGLVLL